MTDDGVTLTSIEHPSPKGWRRVASWLSCLWTRVKWTLFPSRYFKAELIDVETKDKP